jgi:hypothetical protein
MGAEQRLSCRDSIEDTMWNGWLVNKFGSLRIVIESTLGFGLALPLIAESNTVLTLSAALPPIGRRFRMTIQEVLDVVSPLSRDEYVLSLIQLG